MRRMAVGVRLALLAVVVAVVGASPALAQGIGVGAKIGPLFSNLDYSGSLLDVPEFKQRTGWMGGIFFGGNRPGLVGVGAEVNIKKVTSEFAEDGEVGDVDLTTISVPVYLRVNAGSRSKNGVSGYFIIGPGFDVNLRARTTIGDFTQDVKDETEDFELNLNIGGGIEITRFIVELRYIRGLREITNDLSEIRDIKTKGFALLFGVRFN